MFSDKSHQILIVYLCGKEEEGLEISFFLEM